MRSKVLFLVAASAIFAACGGNGEGNATNDDSLLSTDLVHNPATAGGDAESRDMPVLQFTDTVHNFGTIREGEKVEHTFSFTNTGKAPLLISGASASCGCTVPDFPREPITPGKTGIIRVSFDSKGKPGLQDKTVTVSANTARGQHYLKIISEVTPAAE
jgi:hypothetical protein